MNKVIMMGRLTRDPEVRYGGANNTAVARYSIAVDRRFKRDNEPTADFFNCVSFGKQGEFVEKYLRKGSKVLVEGELRNNNYQNKDGQMVYNVEINVANVEFAESKNSQGGSGDFGGGFAPSAAANDGFMNIPDGIEEELPFN
ncbi:MAG: single-stranded DNA-binding protein [Pseudobutyrivibrio sp.]|nr:single-stranded DNA-binding protein [Pseudobutyrivibrio sp.]